MNRESNYPEGGTPASSQIIWLEKRVAELEEKLEEVSKDRDDWARKYQKLHIMINKELKTYVNLLERALVISEKDYEDLKKKKQ